MGFITMHFMKEKIRPSSVIEWILHAEDNTVLCEELTKQTGLQVVSIRRIIPGLSSVRITCDILVGL